jgi:hypothetical protein
VGIVGKLFWVYVQALFSSSATDFLWVLLVNLVGFTYKRCSLRLPLTKRTTLVRKPYKVYQQYPQEISGKRREQHLYINPTRFTNNTHRKSVTDRTSVVLLVRHWFPVDIVGKLCRIYVQALFSSSVTDFLWVLLVNFVGFTYKRCSLRLPLISCGYCW